MVYRRRLYRRRSRRRPAWYNKKYSTAQIARAAWRATKYIKGLVNSEMLHHDVGQDGTTVLSTGTVYALTAISNGDDAGTRTGNSILLRTLLNRIRFTKHASAVTTVVRFMLVWDTQQIGDTTPAAGDILQYADVDSPLNLASSGRFKVLANKTVALSSQMPIWHSERFLKLYKHVRYNGAASADIQRNGLYLLVVGDQATNLPTMDWYARVGYHDN